MKQRSKMTTRRLARKRGVSVLALVLSLTTILCLLGLAIDVGLLVQRHQQLKTAGEAACLAAAHELFGARLDHGADRPLMARQVAYDFAAANYVSGDPLRLNVNF